MKYFHELSIGAQKAVLKSNMTFGEFKKRYKQPPWCNYPDALDPLGCWSLTTPRITKEEDCVNCDLRGAK